MRLLSDSIPEDDQTLYGELAIELLDLLVLWDRLLDNLSWFASEWRAAHPDDSTEMPIAGQHVPRIRDVDRCTIFLRLANKSSVTGDRSDFVAVFNRVKDTRHHVAHAMAMNAMSLPGQARIGIPYYNGNRRVKSLDGGKSVITLALVGKRKRAAVWLIDHVEWARVSEGQSGGPLASDAPRSGPPAAHPRP